MAELLFGVETEYAIAGVSADGRADQEAILQRLMELARQQLVQLPDLNSSTGFFLQNGSRLYVDCGLHPEICTPECTNPWDVVRYIEAGHRILAGLAASVEVADSPGTEIMCFRSNVDYSGSQATWGCHESYMHRMSLDALQSQIIPHLVTRLIYTGAGGFNPLSQGLEFTLSPRMAYFRRVITESSTTGRGIWHAKSEPLCSGYNRLHVLCGESLCSQSAAFLKVGVTALIVALADAGFAPGSAVQLADPLAAMQTVAGDETCKKPLRMAGGCWMRAIDIQRHYLEQVEAHLGSGLLPEWAAEVCRHWRAILHELEGAPGSVEKILDWGIKRALYANHAASLGIRWEDLPFWTRVIDRLVAALVACKDPGKALPLELAIETKNSILKKAVAREPLLRFRGFQWENLSALLGCRQNLFEIDIRFGQLGPKGIFETLDLSNVLNHRVSGVDNIEHAMAEPPAIGRAHVRGQVIRRLAGGEAQCDWQRIVNFGEKQILDLSNPFAGEESWRPLALDDVRPRWLPHRFSGLFEIHGDSGNSDESSAFARRQQSLDLILSGDFAGAELLVRGLLQEEFMVPSTLCHLARVLLMMEREAEAREQIDRAWDIHEQAPAYVLVRMMYFQCVFVLFDGADIADKIGQIKAALYGPDAHLDWTIQPVLDHLRPRLGETNYEFLKALAEALSCASAMPHLETFTQWRDAPILSEFVP